MTESIPEAAPSAVAATEAVASATISHVIIRACVKCGGPRQIDSECAQCGNPMPPEVHDLGVVTATYRNPVRQLLWRLVGQPLAERRIRRANRRAIQLRADRE